MGQKEGGGKAALVDIIMTISAPWRHFGTVIYEYSPGRLANERGRASCVTDDDAVIDVTSTARRTFLCSLKGAGRMWNDAINYSRHHRRAGSRWMHQRPAHPTAGRKIARYVMVTTDE